MNCPCLPSTSQRVICFSRNVNDRVAPSYRGSCPRQSRRSLVQANGIADSVPDPFVAAALRLQSLVRGVGSGEDEMMEQLVAAESPETKLQTSAALGAMISVAAVVIATLCNRDPWGGASLSADTLSWAAVGALASLPLAGLRLWGWTRSASKALPLLDDMHTTQLQVVTPWFMGMSRGHLAIMMALEVLPLSLLLFPAAQGVIEATTGMSSQLIDPLGVGNPGMFTGEAVDPSYQLLVHAVGLALTGAVAASGRGMELSMSEDEYEVVQTAIDNADRYYRLMSMDMKSRGADADRASLAFKSVAEVYLETRSDASVLAGAITFVDVMYLGGLWYMTGNLAAPVVAALAANWVDYYYLHQGVSQKDKLAKGKGSGGSS